MKKKEEKKDKRSKKSDIEKENFKKSKVRKNKKKKKTWKKVLLVLLIILIVAGAWFVYKTQKNGGGVSGMLATVAGHDENTKKNLSEFRVLVLGISTDQTDVDLTDTIMVASYNPNTQKATLLSIPRDTYTGKNSAKATAYEKINALYSRKHRPDETLAAVNEITGLNIEYYVVVKTEALIKLVDVIGGVTFNVPIDMKYDDPTQDLHINLTAGEQLLDGDKAEQLVRFRHNNDYTTYPEEYGDNDTGRMKTQREFIMQVLKQTLKPENIFKIGEILDIANECLITNINIGNAKDYIPYAVEFSTENIITGTLPGVNTNENTNKTWVFVYNKAQTKELVQELFYDRDLEKEQLEESGEATTASKADVKLEVLNGSGDGNKLQKAVKELEGAGYTVTRTGSTNATAKTTIVDKNNSSQSILKNIKDIMGTGEISNSESLTSSNKVNITIIIGKDYE